MFAIEVYSWSGALAPVRIIRGFKWKADAEAEAERLRVKTREESSHVFVVVPVDDSASIGTAP